MSVQAFPSSMFSFGTDSWGRIWAVAAVGGTEVEQGRKVGTKSGLKPGGEEWGLDSEGRDVVETGLRLNKAGKTAKNILKSFIHVFSTFSANT